MGDTAAPPQPPAAGLPGVTPGAGLPGLPGGGPRVHSAIVERLRARIAVCRRHHRSCEGRYERGRAESSDRERQSTRQLLSLVQHGQAARKAARQPRSTAQPDPARPHPHPQPPRSADAHAPAPTALPAAGDPRHSALLALQGSLKRKQTLPTAAAPSKRLNGFIDGDFLDIKRICTGEVSGAGQGPLQANNGRGPMAPGTLPLSQAMTRKPMATPAPAPPAASDNLFCLGLRPVKKEPGEAQSCSQRLDGPPGPDSTCGEDPVEPLMDPELQELFNELSSISVPPMSDLELETMISATIKQGDPFSLDLGQPQSHRSPPGPPLPSEKPLIKTECSLGLGQSPSLGSPQLRPSSAGPAFPASSSLASGPQGQSQPIPGTGRALPSWQDMPHAQQLKQMAASRQQQPSAWPPAPFGQEQTPGPTAAQKPFGAQSSSLPGAGSESGQAKVRGGGYLYKAGPPQQPKPQDMQRGFGGNGHSSSKLLLHFGPEPGGQQQPPALPSASKPRLPPYTPTTPTQPAPPLPGQPLLRSALPITPQKMQSPALTGLGYSVSPQHRQEQTPVMGQSSGTSPSPAGAFLSSQPALLAPQLMGKKPPLQRPLAEQAQKLLLPTQMLSNTEKATSQDQMSRHLLRPPPDYKDQRRNSSSMSPSTPYAGPSPTMTLSSSHTLATPVSTQALMTQAHGPRLPPVSTAVQNQNAGSTFANLPCSQPSQYSTVAGMAQLAPQRNIPQLGSGPGAPRSPRPPTLALSGSHSSAAFVTASVGTLPQPRLSLPHSLGNLSSLAPHQAPPEMLRTPTVVPPGWASQEASAKPQEALKPTGVPFPAVTSATYTPNQSLPQVLGGRQFSPLAAVPSNSLAPAGVQARPLNQVNQALNGQSLGTLQGSTLRPSALGGPMLPALNLSVAGLGQATQAALLAGSFPSTGQTSRPFQGSEPGGADLAFDLLSPPAADGLGPTLSSDTDFLDSLLKTEPGNDDWIKDINLDEILGSHT